MAPQPLEKAESGVGNGMGSEASYLLDLVHGAAGGLDSPKGGLLESSLVVTTKEKRVRGAKPPGVGEL
jgi:hypothetical protein